MADDMDLPVGKLLEHSGQLAQYQLAFRFEAGLTRIEKNAVEDVHGESPLEFGNGHLLGFERPTQFVFDRLTGLGDRLGLVFENLDPLARDAQFVGHSVTVNGLLEQIPANLSELLSQLLDLQSPPVPVKGQQQQARNQRQVPGNDPD